MNYHAFDRDYETTKSARDALVAAVEAHENIDVLCSSTVTPGLVITTYRSFKNAFDQIAGETDHSHHRLKRATRGVSQQ